MVTLSWIFRKRGVQDQSVIMKYMNIFGYKTKENKYKTSFAPARAPYLFSYLSTSIRWTGKPSKNHERRACKQITSTEGGASS